MILAAVSYVADALILGTYALAVRTGRLFWFHAANAVGFVPLCIVELAQHAYPVLPVTGTFGVLGIVGVWRSLTAAADTRD